MTIPASLNRDTISQPNDSSPPNSPHPLEQHAKEVQLASSDGELILCSREALCKISPVFRDLLCDYSDETTFPSPFPAWILREICHPYNSIWKHPQDKNERKTRKLCQLLPATYYYEMEALSQSISYGIRTGMSSTPSLACVVIDEFGLEIDEELRPFIVRLIRKAVQLIEDRPQEVFLSNENDDDRYGVSSVQDPERLQQILAKVNTIQLGGVWLEYKVLYVWASTSDSNRVVAAELWEERDVLARLQADDPDFFARHDVSTISAEDFGTGECYLRLYNHTPIKKTEEQLPEPDEEPEGGDDSAGDCCVCFCLLLVLVVTLSCTLS